MTGHEASSNPEIHAKMSPMTMIFGRDESLRLFEKSHGFFQTGEGSRRIPEDFFPSPKNRTKYVYGTATDDPSPAVYRDDLVCAVISGLTPSENLTGLVSDIEDGDISGLNVVEYQFDRQGETIQMTDQNGTKHDYTLDNLGRQVSDAVTLPAGSLINDNVLRIDTAYDLLGNVALTTSYSSTSGGTANIVNQVADTYNGFGTLTKEQQSVSGAVTSSTPAVLYTYAVDTSTPTRLTSITYPNGRVLTYAYDTGADSAVGRVSYLADSDGTQLGRLFMPWA